MATKDKALSSSLIYKLGKNKSNKLVSKVIQDKIFKK